SGTWSDVAVDETDPTIGWFPGIAIDAAGDPRMCYYDQFYGDLTYARAAAGTWEILFVDIDLNDGGQYSSLAVDASGRPHMSYYVLGGPLTYAVGPPDATTGVGERPLPSLGAMSLMPNPSVRGTRIQLGPDVAGHM